MFKKLSRCGRLESRNSRDETDNVWDENYTGLEKLQIRHLRIKDEWTWKHGKRTQKA